MTQFHPSKRTLHVPLLALLLLQGAFVRGAAAQPAEPAPDAAEAPAAEAEVGEAPAAEAPPVEAEAPPAAPPPAPAPAPEPAPEPAAPEPEPVAPEPEPALAPAPEESAVTLSPIISMFTRHETRYNYGGVGRNVTRWAVGDRIAYRARFGLTTNAIDIGDGYSVTAAIVPQTANFLTTSGGWPPPAPDPAFNMHEGYIKIAKGGARLDVGRMEFVYGDALVIGNLGWHQQARSFDAMRLHMQGDSGAWLDLWVSQTREGMVAPPPETPIRGTGFAGDEYFLGAYADIGKFLNQSMNLDTYVLAQIEPAYETVGDVERSLGSRMTLGVRAKDAIDAFDYRFEGGVQFGSAPALGDADAISRSAYQFDLEAGYKVSGVRVGLEGFVASGDDPDTADTDEGWNEVYPTTHKWLGLTDVMGVRRNVLGGAAHLATKLGATTVKVDGHVFTRPQVPDDADSFAGSELDFNLIYGIGKGLTARGMYGVFLPGSLYANDPDPVHYLEIELAYNYR